jgi:predicted TIM-barrel fold metal-dependent hydrolase
MASWFGWAVVAFLPASVAAKGPGPIPALTPYIDAHTHFDQRDVPGSVQAALKALERQNAAAIFFLAPPDTFDNPGHFDAEVILAAAKQHPGKLAVLGGGGTLNAMIHQAVVSGDSGPQVRKQFRERAEELAGEGVAGFGELTAEHFAGGTPYQYAPADHPLFLLLSDIAAQHGLPIDLHMEAVPQSMPLPPGLKSPPNAPRLQENIAAFERLLQHNPRAKVIWAHAGTDGTGMRTPALCRRLLQAHANLFMEIKTDGSGKNSPLAGEKLEADWLQLFEDFPDRFIIGSDQHYPEPAGVQRWQAPVLLLNQLPPGLQRSIGRDNVLRIYGMAK